MLKSNELSIQFSRTEQFFDVAMLHNSTVSIIGVGGASSLVLDLCRAGVGKFILIDPDYVEGVNISTQGYYEDDINKPKVDILARDLIKTNKNVVVVNYQKKYEQLTAEEFNNVWQSDLILMMTDSFDCQAKGNIDSIQCDKPTIFAAAYLGMDAIEVTFNAPNLTTHCHHCVTLSRYKAREQGFKNPKNAGSHIFTGRLLNAIVGMLSISMLHHYNNKSQPISKLISSLKSNNFLITKLLPDYGIDSGMFTDKTPFTSKSWAPDSPKDFICPDCGTQGVS